MADTQTSAGLQPTGTDPTATNNPQQIVEQNLQPQAGSNLQPTTNQSVESINNLDQGAAAIPVSAIPNTTTAQSTESVQTNTKPVILYGFVTLVCAGILAYILYDTFWAKKPSSKEAIIEAPEVTPEVVTAPVKKPKTKKRKSNKKRKKR